MGVVRWPLHVLCVGLGGSFFGKRVYFFWVFAEIGCRRILCGVILVVPGGLYVHHGDLGDTMAVLQNAVTPSPKCNEGKCYCILEGSKMPQLAEL